MVATATRQTVGQKLQTDLRLTPRILLEALVGLDWLRLRTSAVYWGIGVPQGSGAPVVLVPGFLGTDRYLMEMFHWLRRISTISPTPRNRGRRLYGSGTKSSPHWAQLWWNHNQGSSRSPTRPGSPSHNFGISDQFCSDQPSGYGRCCTGKR